jgi:hypothetical protein
MQWWLAKKVGLVALIRSARDQGCQILLVLCTKMGKNCTKRPQNIPNGHNMYQMCQDKYQKATSKFSIPRPFKLSEIRIFGYENIPSGNPACANFLEVGVCSH